MSFLLYLRFVLAEEEEVASIRYRFPSPCRFGSEVRALIRRFIKKLPHSSGLLELNLHAQSYNPRLFDNLIL